MARGLLAALEVEAAENKAKALAEKAARTTAKMGASGTSLGNTANRLKSGVDLSGEQDLSGAKFVNADLAGCNLSGTKLLGADFTGAQHVAQADLVAVRRRMRVGVHGAAALKARAGPRRLGEAARAELRRHTT